MLLTTVPSSMSLSPPPGPEPAIQAPARLAAVRGAGVLDALRAEPFDSITRLAARLTGVSASFISIVDAERDFYLSEQGFPAELARARQITGRTFCHYTLGGDDPLVIPDTHAQSQWQAVPTVDSLGVRAYLGVPLRVDGQRIGSLCVIDTQPRNWQPDDVETLRQLAASAEREIQFKAAIRKANAEAAYSLQMAKSRESIAAAVVHDLRTPLQVLQLSLVVVRRTNGALQPAVLDRMESAVHSMKTMVASILAETGATPEHMLVSRDITVQALVADAAAMMMPIAESAGRTIAVGALPEAVVHVEYAQILRALGNLIGNSIKYSRPGSHILVSSRRAGQMISIAVHDEGRGMSAHELGLVFGRGFQGGEGMVQGEGAGLGLSIVKQLVEHNGGSVSMESELDRGTIATISLPCTEVDA